MVKSSINGINVHVIYIREKIDDINEHLKTLNGQVYKNTKWRWYTQGIIGLLGVLMTVLISIKF